MSLEKTVSPEFQSFQGFHQMVPPPPKGDGINAELKRSFTWAREVKGRAFAKPARTGHSYVRILDTFLTFPMDLIESMLTVIADEDSENFRIHILVLDPTTNAAEIRAKTLNRLDSSTSDDPFLLTAKGLASLASTMRLAFDLESEPDSNNPDPEKRVEEELTTVRDLADKVLVSIPGLENDEPAPCLEVRFTDSVKEAPVYFISEMVAKGLILDESPASKNPWLLFIDNGTQSGDVYDYLSKNYDQMWKRGTETPTIERTVSEGTGVTDEAFIVMPMSESENFSPDEVKGAIQAAAASQGIEALRADDVTGSDEITAMVRRAIHVRDIVIADVTLAKPNVYYETGYAHALKKPVVLLLDKRIADLEDVHFDIRGFRHLLYDSMTDLQEKLSNELKKLMSGDRASFTGADSE